MLTEKVEELASSGHAGKKRGGAVSMPGQQTERLERNHGGIGALRAGCSRRP